MTLYRRQCSVCTKLFKTRYKGQRFCGDDCNRIYHDKVKKVFGSMKKYNIWLNTGLVDWKDYNEFTI